MKKIKTNNRLFSTVLKVSAVCALSSVLSSPAFAVGENMMNSSAGGNFFGPGYTHGNVPVFEEAVRVRNEVGGSATHDNDVMRYDVNRRRAEDDYYQYNQQRHGTGGSPVTNYANPNTAIPDAMKATIDEVGTKGVYINSIEVSPSEILTREEINSVIGQYVGRNVFMSDIQSAINGLNTLYAEKGYVTARAYLPEQTVTNGNIKIELIESRIGNVTVVNNRYTTDNYILKRIPEKSGQLFDIVNLEQDVLDFNRYHEGVNLAANLRAGEIPGTTDIELTAQETFPFHLIGMMDNAGRRSTGVLRGGPAIVADSLFHHRDQMSVGTYFSKGATSPFFDYSYPVNKKDGKVGFSFSSTFAKVKNGPYDWMGLKSNSYIYSLYYDQPLVRKPGFELRSLASLNYKRSRSWSNLGNLFSEAYGFHVDDPIKDTDQVTSIDLGLNMRKDTKYGIWYLNQNASLAVPIFDSESSYFKMSGGFLRLHDFSHGFIGQLRGSYQVIPNSKHIPYLDQFQTGGLATVRGYSEGVMLGKSGYFFSGELMFPLLPRTVTKNGETRRFIGHYLKGALFADTSGVFPYVGEDVYGGSYFLASIGMGVRVQLPGDLSARLYWGYPLVNNAYEQHRHMGRFHFELTLEPDLDGLLSKRRPEPYVQPAPQPQQPQLPPVAPPENNYDDIRHYDYLLDGSATAL